MADLERTYIIPLRREILKVPKYKRAQKAVKAVRIFLMKHMKSDDVKIGRYINLKLHEHGRKNPPVRVNVKAIKDSKGVVRAELVGAPEEKIKEETKKEEKKEIKEEPKVEEKKEEKLEHQLLKEEMKKHGKIEGEDKKLAKLKKERPEDR